MKKKIFLNYSILRVLRLCIGIAIFIQAIIEKNVLLGIAGLFFAGMAIANVGCCTTGACNMKEQKKNQSSKDYPYEEMG